jgi:hypothetical protein
MLRWQIEGSRCTDCLDGIFPVERCLRTVARRVTLLINHTRCAGKRTIGGEIPAEDGNELLYVSAGWRFPRPLELTADLTCQRTLDGFGVDRRIASGSGGGGRPGRYGAQRWPRWRIIKTCDDA